MSPTCHHHTMRDGGNCVPLECLVAPVLTFALRPFLRDLLTLSSCSQKWPSLRPRAWISACELCRKDLRGTSKNCLCCPSPHFGPVLMVFWLSQTFSTL